MPMIAVRERLRIAQSRPRRTQPTPTPVPSTRHQLKLLQTWQPFNLREAAATCQAYGFTGILAKAMDGTAWMGSIERSQDAISNLDELRRHVDYAHSLGLYFFAWTNPLVTVELQLQATLYGQIARSCDGLFIDCEPYDGFWGANRNAGLAAETMRIMRLEAPDAFIALQPDPRLARLQEIRVHEWMAGCDAFSGQHYWSDFTKPRTANINDALAQLDWARELGEDLGVPSIPTVPGNAPLSSFPVGVLQEFPGYVVYRHGTTPHETMDLLGQLEMAGLESTKIPLLR